jgi:hypothetical protein
MLTWKYRRIYHYHLKKCGGTTINRWLDTITFDERTFKAEAWKSFPVVRTSVEETGEIVETIIPSRARTLFHWTDVVYGHRPLRIYAPENTFCFTVLRDPVQRLVSEVSDWRRLNESDTINSPPNMRECVADSRQLSLRDFLEKHGRRGGREFLDNYMTRALVAGRMGNTIDGTMDPGRLSEVALQGLEKDYDLIGLTEHMDLSRNAFCAMVGLPPAGQIPTLNVTRIAGHNDPELRDAHDILNDLTCVDRVIYDRARQLFDRRHRQTAEDYDTVAFETQHAGRLLAEARGYSFDGGTRYSIRAPIIGSGFHGRDGGGTVSCAVWSGPEIRSTLYIPTPPNMALSLLVWIRGYVDVRQRDQLRVRVDGRPTAHRFDQVTDYADLLRVDTTSAGNFVRLEIDIDETLGSGDPDSGNYDPRERGFSFDSYGWRPTS